MKQKEKLSWELLKKRRLFLVEPGKKGGEGSKCGVLTEGERHFGGLGQLEHPAL